MQKIHHHQTEQKAVEGIVHGNSLAFHLGSWCPYCSQALAAAGGERENPWL